MADWYLDGFKLNQYGIGVNVQNAPYNRAWNMVETSLHPNLDPYTERAGAMSTKMVMTISFYGLSDDKFEIIAAVQGLLNNRKMLHLKTSGTNSTFFFEKFKEAFIEATNWEVNQRSEFGKAKIEATMHFNIKGTPQTHSLTMEIARKQLENDWEKVGKTTIALPKNATNVSETVDESRGNTQIVISPSWSDDATYTANEVKYGSIDFDVDGDVDVYDNACKLTDGLGGRRILGKMYPFTGNPVIMNNLYRIEIDLTANELQFEYSTDNGDTWNTMEQFYFNSHADINKVKVLHNNDEYIVLKLNNGALVEIHRGKDPVITPGGGNILHVVSAQTAKTNNSGSENHLQLDHASLTDLYVACDRFFEITTSEEIQPLDLPADEEARFAIIKTTAGAISQRSSEMLIKYT